jgi:hypothetical protein
VDGRVQPGHEAAHVLVRRDHERRPERDLDVAAPRPAGTGRQDLVRAPDQDREDRAPGALRDQPDARPESAHLAGPRPGALREDEDVPAASEQGLGGGHRIRARGPDELERAQPGGEEPAHPVGAPVVGGDGGREPAPVVRAEREAERGRVQVARVGGADDRGLVQLREVLGAAHARAAHEPAEDRPEQARRRLARERRGAAELPAVRCGHHPTAIT